jgi:hypothetical protein
VSTGTPEQAAAFRDERGLRAPLYVDPRMRAYSAAGLRRGMLRVMSLKAAVNAGRALRSGEHQGATQGDPWQLGGAFVVLPPATDAPAGRVVFEQRSEIAGDHADPDAILSALAAGGGGGAGGSAP